MSPLYVRGAEINCNDETRCGRAFGVEEPANPPLGWLVAIGVSGVPVNGAMHTQVERCVFVPDVFQKAIVGDGEASVIIDFSIIPDTSPVA